MASWEDYVNLLLEDKLLENVAFIGYDGTIWGSNFGTRLFCDG